MKLTPTTKRVAVGMLAAALPLSMAAGTLEANSSTGSAGGELTMWTHNAGNKAELAAITAIVNDYNASQKKYKVKIQAFPQDSYNQSVVAAAASNQLPCILDIDGPNAPNWAWAGYLAPLTGLDDTLSKYLPTVLGKYDNKTYSYGYYDVALVMVTLKTILDKYGSRVPTADSPWTKDEFDAALKKIKASGDFQNPLDIATSFTGEWWLRILPDAPELRRRPHQPRRLQDGRGLPQRAEGRRVGDVVPQPRHRRARPAQVRRRPGQGLHQRQVRDPLQRHVDGRRHPQGLRQGHPLPPAAGPRHRPEDRWRLVAVGHLAELLRPGRRARLHEVRGAGQVRRKRRPGHEQHPGDGCGRRAGQGLREGRGERDLPRLREEVRPAATRDPGLPLHRDGVHEDRAGHPQRRRPQAGARPGRQEHRRQPEVQRLLPVTRWAQPSG